MRPPSSIVEASEISVELRGCAVICSSRLLRRVKAAEVPCLPIQSHLSLKSAAGKAANALKGDRAISDGHIAGVLATRARAQVFDSVVITVAVDVVHRLRQITVVHEPNNAVNTAMLAIYVRAPIAVSLKATNNRTTGATAPVDSAIQEPFSVLKESQSSCLINLGAARRRSPVASTIDELKTKFRHKAPNTGLAQAKLDGYKAPALAIVSQHSQLRCESVFFAVVRHLRRPRAIVVRGLARNPAEQIRGLDRRGAPNEGSAAGRAEQAGEDVLGEHQAASPECTGGASLWRISSGQI